MIHTILETMGLAFMLFSSFVVSMWILDRALSDGARAKAKVINLKDRSKKR
jgi:hypothetical protein